MSLTVTVLRLALLLPLTLAANPLTKLANQVPRLNAQIEKLEPCPELPKTPIQFKNLVISQAGFNKYVLNGKIKITKRLDKPITVVMEMYRCSSKEDPTSCEYYFTFRKNNICNLLENKDKSWDFFTNGTNLPRTCPFPPKEYTVDGATVDLRELKFVPFFQSHWRLKNKVYMDKELMFCLISEFTLQMVKGP